MLVLFKKNFLAVVTKIHVIQILWRSDAAAFLWSSIAESKSGLKFSVFIAPVAPSIRGLSASAWFKVLVKAGL